MKKRKQTELRQDTSNYSKGNILLNSVYYNSKDEEEKQRIRDYSTRPLLSAFNESGSFASSSGIPWQLEIERYNQQLAEQQAMHTPEQLNLIQAPILKRNVPIVDVQPQFINSRQSTLMRARDGMFQTLPQPQSTIYNPVVRVDPVLPVEMGQFFKLSTNDPRLDGIVYSQAPTVLPAAPSPYMEPSYGGKTKLVWKQSLQQMPFIEPTIYDPYSSSNSHKLCIDPPYERSDRSPFTNYGEKGIYSGLQLPTFQGDNTTQADMMPIQFVKQRPGLPNNVDYCPWKK